jgi:hypothetical protein
MKKFFKMFFALLAIVLILAQFISPLRTNPVGDKSKDISSSFVIPSNVKQILERSCYDCHSNNTRWPWYSNIAPVSWLIAQDVNEGREHLNFSEWGSYEQTDRITYLEDICKNIKKGEMPMQKYLILHSDAKLSDADKDIICKWTKAMSDSLMNN